MSTRKTERGRGWDYLLGVGEEQLAEEGTGCILAAGRTVAADHTVAAGRSCTGCKPCC